MVFLGELQTMFHGIRDMLPKNIMSKMDMVMIEGSCILIIVYTFSFLTVLGHIFNTNKHWKKLKLSTVGLTVKNDMCNSMFTEMTLTKHKQYIMWEVAGNHTKFATEFYIIFLLCSTVKVILHNWCGILSNND